jgi:DNA repair protein RecN (Recombination protein N)
VKDPKLNELLERIKASLIELDDIASVAEDDLSELDINPNKLDELMTELDKYNAALRKHHFTSQNQLIELRDKLNSEVSESENIDDNIQDLEEEVNTLLNQCQKVASEISSRRKSVLPQLESDIKQYLARLKINDATVSFELKDAELTALGIDGAALYFSPNQGLSPQLIEKAASGGELSRLMLVLQYLLSQKKQLPTVIFDEIDTGVSGDVALKIGNMLSAMGEFLQVVSITHLPQIASKGEQHLKVYKNELNAKTTTQLKALSQEERILEIAEMLGGDATSTSAIAHAKTLFE